MKIEVKPVTNCKISFIRRAKIGICTKVLNEINISCGKKYGLENSHSTVDLVQKIKNSLVPGAG